MTLMYKTLVRNKQCKRPVAHNDEQTRDEECDCKYPLMDVHRKKKTLDAISVTLRTL